MRVRRISLYEGYEKVDEYYSDTIPDKGEVVKLDGMVYRVREKSHIVRYGSLIEIKLYVE